MQTASRHVLDGTVFGVTVRGDSMRPFLPAGERELLFVRRPAEELFAGDVVLYGVDGSRAVHRIFWRTDGGFWIGDDAGRMDFHFVPSGDVRAQLVKTCPQGLAGWILGLLARLIYQTGRIVKTTFLP